MTKWIRTLSINKKSMSVFFITLMILRPVPNSLAFEMDLQEIPVNKNNNLCKSTLRYSSNFHSNTRVLDPSWPDQGTCSVARSLCQQKTPMGRNKYPTAKVELRSTDSTVILRTMLAQRNTMSVFAKYAHEVLALYESTPIYVSPLPTHWMI